MATPIRELLGPEADSLLNHVCKTVPKENRCTCRDPISSTASSSPSDRNPRVLCNLQRMFNTGRLAGTGYLSILPVDQGIEHSAGASFAKNPQYFDPENIVKLAIEGGCNAVASTFGVLGAVRPQVRPQDPVPRQDQPQRAPDLSQQVRPGPLRHRQGGLRHGRRGRRRDDLLRLRAEPPARSSRSARPSRRRTSWAWRRSSGATCATARFKKDKDYHVAADLTGQANHLGVTIQADIIKQKLPENNGGFKALNPGQLDATASWTSGCTRNCATDHPIDLCRYQVANCYMGRVRPDQLAAAPAARTTWPRP